MPIQITARVHGFRRCGMAHSANACTYPDDHFTAAELATLEAEPQLIVVRVSDEQETASDSAALSAAQARIAELEKTMQEREAQLTAAQDAVAALTTERDALQAQLAAAATATDDSKAKK
ncbi:HI1506-related protein [Dickeya oryzae]